MRRVIPLLMCLLFVFAISIACAQTKPHIQVFYKEKQPSLQTYEKVKEFLSLYADKYQIDYLLMSEEHNVDLMKSYGFPTDHFPFGIAVDGKTSAKINDELIIFAKFPDFMHHIGRHEGNWTLEYLKIVLDNNSLLQEDNPLVTVIPGGGR